MEGGAKQQLMLGKYTAWMLSGGRAGLKNCVGFELFPRWCNFLRGCKAYGHVDTGLQHIVFELILPIMSVTLHYRIGFELNM